MVGECRAAIPGVERPQIMYQETKLLSGTLGLFFDRFHYTLSYQTGSKNAKPEALSYQHQGKEEVKDLGSETTILAHKMVLGIRQWT